MYGIIDVYGRILFKDVSKEVCEEESKRGGYHNVIVDEISEDDDVYCSNQKR